MKKGKTEKTNAARLLDKAGVKYELVPYEVDEDDLSAGHIASQLDEPIEQVFKTLVLEGDRTGHFVCVLPGNREVDLKAAAKVSGNKKCDLIPMKELLPLTGYIRGGCSPVGMKKPFPTYFDSSAALYPFIYVSAGMRGLQLKISPSDIVEYVGASLADISTEGGPSGQ
ncbi:MAG: Cys-tRNA(Pro) deacylase [Candidatus Cryptobacteroides sp.]